MLLRPNLTFHPDGHPVLSRAQIEEFAESFLTRYFPNNLRYPTALTCAQLMTLVNEEDGVESRAIELGSEGNRKRLGRIYLKQKLIALDPVLFSERQVSLPFVMAHEFAHWLLHRDCEITVIKQREHLPDDDEGVEEIGKPARTWTSLRRIEWQASTLAAALLIPQQAAITAIYSVQIDMEIPLRKGIIYENPTPESHDETEEQFKRIAKIFGISKTVLRIRLADRSLYHRQPAKGSDTRSAGHPFWSLSDALKSTEDSFLQKVG